METLFRIARSDSKVKWLDGKGKIGGVVNIFDMTVLVLVVWLIAYYSFLAPELLPPDQDAIADTRPTADEKEAKGSQGIVTDVQFVFSDLELQVVHRIKAGLKDTSHPGTTAEITEVLAVDKAVKIVEFGRGLLLTQAPGDKWQVRVRMKIRGLRRGKTFYYKSKPLVRESFYTFVTPEMTLVGEALRLDDRFAKRFMPLRKRLQFRGHSWIVDKRLAEMVKVGDPASPLGNIQTRLLRVEIKKILSNREVHPMEIDVGGGGWTWDVSFHRLELILECVCAYDDEKGYYYGRQKIRVGDAFIFESGLYRLPLVIQAIEIFPPKVRPAG